MRKSKSTISKTSKSLKPLTDAREGNTYDKVIKENLEQSLKTIIQDIGGIHFIKWQPMPTKMQHTKERDPDELSMVWLLDGSQHILHAEAHLKDEEEVNLRMCDYHIMLKRKHKKLPIIHFVLYIGSKDPKHIKGYWQSESMTFNYKVIVLKDIPYETFLKAANPETVVFSILADFHNEDPETVAKKISMRLKVLAETDSSREKYYTQLRVLSNIRKLQPIIDKVMANIFKMIDISEDPLYVKGIKEGNVEGEQKGRLEGRLEGEQKGRLEGEQKGKLEGEQKAKLEAIESLITKSEFDDSYISYLMSISVDLVSEIRQKMAKERNKNGH